MAGRNGRARWVLQIALTRLAKHYGLISEDREGRGRTMRHWGEADYRPSLDGWREEEGSLGGGRLVRGALASGFGVSPDALHHGHQAIGALRGQMFVEMQRTQGLARIDVEDFVSRLPRIDGEQDRHQPTHDMGVAVADEKQARGAAIGSTVVESQTWLTQP